MNVGPRSGLFRCLPTFLEAYRGSRRDGTGREDTTTTDHSDPKEGGRSRARVKMPFIVSMQTILLVCIHVCTYDVMH